MSSLAITRQMTKGIENNCPKTLIPTTPCLSDLILTPYSRFPPLDKPLSKLLLVFFFSVTGHSSLFPMEDGFPDDERGEGLAGLGSPHCFPHQNGERVERYSRKVFVGGLPPDIDEGKESLTKWKTGNRLLKDTPSSSKCNLCLVLFRRDHSQFPALWSLVCGLASQSWE